MTPLKAMLHVSNKTAVYSRTGHREWEHLSFIIINLLLLLLLQQFYIPPLQGNLLRSAPSPTSVKQCGLKARVKYNRLDASDAAQPGYHSRLATEKARLYRKNIPLMGDQSVTCFSTLIHIIIMIKFTAAAVLDLSVFTTQSLSYHTLVRNWI